ncbi:eukaryotic translation initiation factor 3 subunit G-like, partial [Trifolium medium]|nr:eukaryotic translation initiation factor 3 subunit G-like [Trifolium medium]
MLELFKPIGYVHSAKLAIDHETSLGGGFGFVTFVTKEDAQKAIEERNGYVYGQDKCTMKVDWVTRRTALSPRK